MGWTTPLERHLVNGAQVYLSPNPTQPSLTVMVGARVGSRQDPAGQEGISHYLEHMVFNGTERYPSSDELQGAISEQGGVSNAATDYEVTNYYAKVLSARWEVALDVISELVSRPLFAPAQVERERGVIQQEARGRFDNPGIRSFFACMELLYPCSSYGNPIEGTVESVAGITRQQIRDHFERYHHQQGLFWVVTGGFESERVLEWLERNLRLPAAPTALPSPLPSSPALPRLTIENRDLAQQSVCMGIRANPLDTRQALAGYVLDKVYGVGVRSRLYRELREKRSLVYDAAAHSTPDSDNGRFLIRFGCVAERADEAAVACLDELEKIADGHLPQNEVKQAVAELAGLQQMGLENNSSLAGWITRRLVTLGEAQTPEQLCTELETITVEEVRQVAADLLSRPIQAAAVGQVTDLPQLTARIEALARPELAVGL